MSLFWNTEAKVRYMVEGMAGHYLELPLARLGITRAWIRARLTRNAAREIAKEVPDPAAAARLLGVATAALDRTLHDPSLN